MTFSTLVVLALAASTALAPGDRAPELSLPSTRGTPVSLAEPREKQPMLVVFFPAVFSPGCTAQLVGYRDEWKTFTDAGVAVYGISTDAPFSQKAFADAYKLPFPLLSDQDHAAMKAFGVPPLKEHYATRSVFLFDKAGSLAYVDLSYEVGKSEPKLRDALRAVK